MNFLKTGLLLALSLLISEYNYCQPQIVDWSYEIVKDGDTHKVVITGDIKDDWVIYSQHTEKGGPVATRFEFEPHANYTFDGPVKEKSEAITKYSELFELNVTKFKDQAVFEQTIKNYNSGDVVTGTITYMSCNSKKCLPPQTIEFEVKG